MSNCIQLQDDKIVYIPNICVVRRVDNSVVIDYADGKNSKIDYPDAQSAIDSVIAMQASINNYGVAAPSDNITIVDSGDGVTVRTLRIVNGIVTVT